MITRRIICTALCAVVFGIFLLGLTILAFCFDKVVDEIIKTELPLQPNGTTFNLWRKPPATPYLKVYLFNVTNHEEYLQNYGTINSTKLVVQEFGPYVYSEAWEKVDVTWNPSGTISYKQKKVYHFEPGLSFGSEDDEYTLPNVPMLSAIASTKYQGRAARKAVSTMFQMLPMEPFVKKTVREWLWGYEDSLLKLGRMVAPEKTPFEQFGFWYGRNDTPGKVFTVRTGMKNLNELGKIVAWDEKSELAIWANDSSCNAIRGTDGTAFSAFLHPNTTVSIFNEDMCRSIQLARHSTVKHDDIKIVYRFRPVNATFGDVETFPENQCFCPSGQSCSKLGTFNVSACQHGAPVFISWPHFLHGDPSLLEDVGGLRPNETLHQFYLDIEPRLGVPVQAKARVQLNIQLVKVGGIKQSDNFTEVLIPMLWFEDGIDSLPDEIMDKIRLAVVLPEQLQDGLKIAAIGLGVVLLFGSLLLGCWTVTRKMRGDALPKEGEENYEFDNMAHNAD